MSDLATIELKYVKRYQDRHGKVRHYFRAPGRKLAPLPGLPGSVAFMAAYAEALDAMSVPEGAGKAPKAGTVSALCVAYYASTTFKGLNVSTKRTYRNILDRFRAVYGEGPAKALRPTHIKTILDKTADRPGAARNLLKALRSLFAFAAERGLVAINPTAGVKFKAPKSDGFRAWSEDDIEAFRNHWPAGSRARLALALLVYTGQRRSDVVRMGRQHIRDGCIQVRQKKRGVDAPVLSIPIHPDLKAELDALPKEHLTFLMTAYGKPMSEAGFTGWFVRCAKDAGLPAKSSPHGLRKAAARRLAEAGCSAHEIMAITGHESLKEVERYTATASQGKLAKSAMARSVNGSLSHLTVSPDPDAL